MRLFRPIHDFVAIAGMTYVLNTRSLKGRLFVETADGGLIEMMNNPLHFAPGQYPLGTMDSERPAMPVDFPFLCRCFVYLTSRFWAVEIFNTPTAFLPKGGLNYSLADLFNRWYVPGTPPPTTGLLASNPCKSPRLLSFSAFLAWAMIFSWLKEPARHRF